jgi:hypothetical protein
MLTTASNLNFPSCSDPIPKGSGDASQPENESLSMRKKGKPDAPERSMKVETSTSEISLMPESKPGFWKKAAACAAWFGTAVLSVIAFIVALPVTLGWYLAAAIEYMNKGYHGKISHKFDDYLGLFIDSPGKAYDAVLKNNKN